MKLLAITGALAKSIKQVIVTNALDEDGKVSSAAKQLANNSEEIIENAREKIEEIRRLDLKGKAVKPRIANEEGGSNIIKSNKKSLIWDAFRNILSPFVGFLGVAIALMIHQPEGIVDNIFVWMFFSTFALVGINVNTSFKIFRGLRNIYSFTLFLEFAFLLYYTGSYIIEIQYFWWWIIGVLIISSISNLVFQPSDRSGSLIKLLSRYSSSVFYFALAIVIYRLLIVWGGSSKISMIITQFVYVPLGLSSVFFQDYTKKKK